MARGGKRPGAGRPPGAKTRVTAEARAAFKDILEGRVDRVGEWIDAAANEDPAKAADLMLKLAEFVIPRLQRMSIDITKLPIEEIAAELARREQDESEPAGSLQ